MWKTSRETKRAALVFLIIGFGIPIISFLFEYIPNPSIYQERKANMRLEYEKIVQPINSKQINLKVYEKITKLWISGRFSVPMNKEEIEEYYRAEVRRNGWMEEKGVSGELRFRKGNLLFEITAKDGCFSNGIYYESGFVNF